MISLKTTVVVYKIAVGNNVELLSCFENDTDFMYTFYKTLINWDEIQKHKQSIVLTLIDAYFHFNFCETVIFI